MHVRFGGERLETCRRNTVRRWALTLLMTSLAPIPFATFTNREQSQIGQNYLRSLIALGFQGFLIMVCVGIYAVLIQNIPVSEHIAATLWGIVGYTVLLVFTLFKTGSLSKSIMNAH